VAYRIEWRPRARKAFLSLDQSVRRRIGSAVDAVAADPRPSGAKMITGAHGVLRIRVGDYRVLYPDAVVLIGIPEDRHALGAVLPALFGALGREDRQEPLVVLHLRGCQNHV
jgi:mRNA interferase RelE/StbE